MLPFVKCDSSANRHCLPAGQRIAMQSGTSILDNPDVEILARGDGSGGGASNSGGANHGSQLKGTIVDIEPSRIGMAWSASAATKTADGGATLGLRLL